MKKRKKRSLPTYAGGGLVPVEVEGGEVAQTPGGNMIQFEGPNHESGGIPTVLPEDTEIYSKRISVDGDTMAQRKQARERKKNRLGKIILEDPTNQINRNSAKRTMSTMVQQEMEDQAIQQAVSPYIGMNPKNRVRLNKDQVKAFRESATGTDSSAAVPSSNGLPQYFGGIASLQSTDLSAEGAQAALSNTGGGPSLSAVPWGQLASGLAAIGAQLAQGRPESVQNPLLAETAALRPYKNGGRVGKALNPEMVAISGVLNQRNQGLNWVQRGLNPQNYPSLTDPQTGETMTHRLSYANDDQGYYVYPNVIQNEDGTLQDLDPDEAHGWARESNTIMRVPSREVADFYTKQGLIRHPELEEYASGGKAKHWIQKAVNPKHKGYSIGDEYDMPDDEIQSLIAQGYKVQRL